MEIAQKLRYRLFRKKNVPKNAFFLSQRWCETEGDDLSPSGVRGYSRRRHAEVFPGFQVYQTGAYIWVEAKLLGGRHREKLDRVPHLEVLPAYEALRTAFSRLSLAITNTVGNLVHPIK